MLVENDYESWKFRIMQLNQKALQRRFGKCGHGLCKVQVGSSKRMEDSVCPFFMSYDKLACIEMKSILDLLCAFTSKLVIDMELLSLNLLIDEHYNCHNLPDYFNDFEKEFPAIVYNDAQTSKLDLLTEPIEASISMNLI
ncbi:hypothetical protein Tco_0472423 [Tanacetum coccineum]